MLIFTFCAIVIILIVAVFIAVYNRLIKLKNVVMSQFAHIDVMLQNRADLIPNLVETVKGYTKHERETLEAVMRARENAMYANTIHDKIQADNQLSGALGRLLAVSEAYPDLKANESFNNLQEQLSESEKRIRYARQLYNEIVLTYNNSLSTFPNNIIAGILGFKPWEYFRADETSRAVPNVSF